MILDEATHDELRAELAALTLGDAAGAHPEPLVSEKRARLAAHLAECPACARELELQAKVRERLSRLAAPGPAPRPLAAMVRGLARGELRPLRRRRWIAAAASGWAAAASLAIAWWAAAPPVVTHPPMVEAALRDFGRAIAEELPPPQALAELAAAVGHPVPPLEHAGLSLVSTWQTEIRGEHAAALAYRVGGRIVVQYVLPESLLYRQPVVRDAVEAHGIFTTSDGERSVVAFAGGGAGSVVVGALSPAELAGFTVR